MWEKLEQIARRCAEIGELLTVPEIYGDAKELRRLTQEQKEGMYRDIHDDARWLVTLVENLLSITRIDNGTMQIAQQPELVSEVVHEALLHVDRRASARRVDVLIEDDLLMAVMDARLIVQVIINLVNNAIQYTPEGSRITIRSFLEGQELVVEVADDGPGIPDAMKERIFDLFYTSRGQIADSRRGMGLGLALCQSIISAHGGRLAVRDNVPHGALFSFRCPAEEVCAYESTVDFNRGRR